jgi:hypothetical protein
LSIEEWYIDLEIDQVRQLQLEGTIGLRKNSFRQLEILLVARTAAG